MTDRKKPMRLIRRPEVEERTSLSRSAIYAEVKKGTFPAPVPLSGSRVAWLESEIDTWIKNQIQKRPLTRHGGH